MKKYILKYKEQYVFNVNKGMTLSNAKKLAQRYTDEQAVEIIEESDFDLEMLEV